MGAEYELKYRADADCLASVLTTFPARWETLEMQTTYYDTPDRSLSARRYMLRTRLENGVCVCTLKTPGVGNTRGEWEVPAQSIAAGISELCKLSVPADFSALCEKGVIPVCGARFTRKAGLFTLRSGSLELALDQGILFSGSRECPLCEIEVEHKSGDVAATDAFARQLAEIYDLQPEPKSKFARALEL